MQLGIGRVYNRIRYDTGDIILNDLKAVVLHCLLSTVEESVSSAALPHTGSKRAAMVEQIGANHVLPFAGPIGTASFPKARPVFQLPGRRLRPAPLLNHFGRIR
jgi:hypothetical protein